MRTSGKRQAAATAAAAVVKRAPEHVVWFRLIHSFIDRQFQLILKVFNKRMMFAPFRSNSEGSISHNAASSYDAALPSFMSATLRNIILFSAKHSVPSMFSDDGSPLNMYLVIHQNNMDKQCWC